MAGRSGVAVVGSLHFDIMVAAPYLPRTGETLIGDAWWWKPGGKGGNQAMASARHGAATQMIGCLGDDVFGLRLRERLLGAGVGLDHVSTLTAGSGMSVAIQQDGGDYAAIVVSGANLGLQPAHVEAAAGVIDSSAVLVLQNEIDESANVAAASAAHEAGATVVLNAAPARRIGRLDGLVDVLVVNGIEAEQLGADPVTDLATAARAAQTLGSLAPAVVVTAGGAGIAAIQDGTGWTLAAHPIAQPQTHGAGDVFTGGLAARLAAGDALDGALRYANAAAALHVGTAEADRDRLGQDEVQGLLSEAGSG